MPALTVGEHFTLALLSNTDTRHAASLESMLTVFPALHALKKKLAGNLSGGQRQMLSFGLLLLQGTDTWLLDEPTAGLAPSVVEFTTEFLEQKNRNGNITMLIVEHNMDVAFRLATHVMVAKNGTLSRKFNREDFGKKEFLTESVYN